MKNSSQDNYNPLDAGKPFNYQPHRMFTELSDDDKLAAFKRNQQVIDDARFKIGDFTQLTED